MKKIKEIVKFIVVILVMIVFLFAIVFSITFPIVISAITDNWWYMFLYFAVPVLLPAMIFLAQVFVAIIEIILNKTKHGYLGRI